MMTSKALYVHVPFCAHICTYCDFTHVIYNDNLVTQWLMALQKEIFYYSLPKNLDTVYLGGGTPVSLKAEYLNKLLCLLDPYCQNVQEYTIEINPEVMNLEKAKICYAHGINRASIGYQSANQKLLHLLGRKHNLNQVAKTIEILNEVGINNISLDIMYSLPGQTMAMLKDTVEKAIILKPNHLSLYSLTIEPNTVFSARGYTALDNDKEADMYDWICSYLPSQGYQQYEIANFAKAGFNSKHNQVYWHYDDFIGLSAGASGKENHCRYDKPKSLKAYLADPCKRYEINLSKYDEMFESIMMGLRLKQGILITAWNNRFQAKLNVTFAQALYKHLRLNNLEIKDGYLRCTKKGYPILQTILVDFL